MKREYKYIHINNIYINDNLNIIILFKKLMFDVNPLKLESKLPYPMINKLPSLFNKLFRVFRLSIKYFSAKHFNQNKEFLRLNNFGHIVLKRQLNNVSIDKSVYKIFNLNNRHLISQYDTTVLQKEILPDINKLNEVKDLKITPKLLEVNLQDKYYVEEYLNFKHPNSKEWNKSLDLITDFIKELYVHFPLIKKSKNDFIKENKYTIHENILVNPLYSKKANKIMEYVKIKTEKLADFEKETVLYAQSHGDLNSGNFFINKNQVIGLDWELLKYRSLYYDVFYFVLIVNRKDFNLVDENQLDIKTQQVVKYLNEINEPKLLMTEKDIEFYINCFILEYLNWKFRVYLSYKNNNDFQRKLTEIIKDIYYFEKIGNKIIAIHN